MTLEEKAEEYVIKNICENCNHCQSKGYIGCDTYRFAKKTYIDSAKELDEISDKVIEEQEARDLLSAINCYLLCDFGVQDIEMQAQVAAEKERILKIQKKLKRIIGE